MISDLIVWSSVALALVFVAAWAASPALRAWIERPKHQFLSAVQGYDRGTRPAVPPAEPRTP
ncbi:MAG: hypothetical protein IT181_19195 [Acidobacteria bacterium]|nr:hypothetical protein [Acidobacteriota bacterium]